MKLVPASTIPSCCHVLSCCPFLQLHAFVALHLFLVFLLFTLVVITYVLIVWYVTWFVRLYNPFLYTVERETFFAVNKIRAQFSHFSSFLSFSLPFLAAKPPSKDDNLEDERLKPLPP